MENEILKIINRETKALDSQDVDLFLSIFHKDMVWPWPSCNKDHDPIKWELKLGKFDYKRWKDIYVKFFKENKLVHNKRKIIKIQVSKEGDGAIAVIDIDTLWENLVTKKRSYWFGRVSKVYAKVSGEWKLTMHIRCINVLNKKRQILTRTKINLQNFFRSIQ